MSSYKLNELCEIINGFTPSTKNKDFWTNGTIPFYRRENLINENKPFKKINTCVFEKKHRKTLQEGTILSGNTTLVVDWKKENIHFKDHMFLLKVKDIGKVNEKYLHFYLIKNKKTLFQEKSKTNSMFAVVEKKEISDFDIILPNKEYQDEVGDILWNRLLIINNLKNTINLQKKELDLLFKSVSKQLENNELTEYRVDDLFEILRGSTPPTKTPKGKINPWINNEVLFYRGRDFTRNDGTADKKINNEWIKGNNKENLLIKEYDITIYTVGSIKVLKLPEKSFCGTDVFILRNKNKNISNPDFLLYFFKNLETELNNKYASTGTLFKRLRTTDLSKVPILLPPLEIQNKIGSVLKVKQEMLAMTKKILKQQQTLLDVETKLLIK